MSRFPDYEGYRNPWGYNREAIPYDTFYDQADPQPKLEEVQQMGGKPSRGTPKDQRLGTNRRGTGGGKKK